MYGLDIFRVVISPSSTHTSRVPVVRYDVVTVGKFFVTEGALPLLARRSFGLAAFASQLANGVRDIP